MIDQLTGLPAHTVGFKLSGQLHDEDHKKLIPLVDDEIGKEGIGKEGKVRSTRPRRGWAKRKTGED